MPLDINPRDFLQGIPPKKLLKIIEVLQSRWADVLEHITEDDVRSPGDFNLEDCRSNRTGKDQARYMLNWLGNHGMRISCLIRVLDELRLERALICLKDPESLQIVEQPKSFLEVYEGDTIKMTCTAIGFPYPRYTWFKNRQEVSSGLNGTLEIRDAREDHSGHYKCRIHNEGSSNILWSRNGRWSEVSVKEAVLRTPPFFTLQPPEKLNVNLGTSFYLECCVESATNISYQWYKDGKEIQNADKALLEISSASHDLGGEYHCCVENKYGSAQSISCLVQIYREPNETNIIEHPVNQTTVIGGTVSFSVRVDNPFNVSYQWFHNGKPMPNETLNTLILDVRSKEQKGTYQCSVERFNNEKQQVCQLLSLEAKLEVNMSRVVKTAEDKVALILANADFSNQKDLPGVYNDTIKTTEELEKLNFKVYSYLNLTIEEMWAALIIFSATISEGVYVLVYLAGHGFIYHNQEYLMPSNALKEKSYADDNLCIARVINYLQKKKPGLMVVVTECCLKQWTEYIIEVPGEECEVLKTCATNYIIHSNGPEERAFEEKNVAFPRGLFNTYFLKAIKQKVTLPDMLKSLKKDFDDRPYDKVKYPMTINHNTDLQDEELSLHDLIIVTDMARMNDRSAKWEAVHCIPAIKAIRFECGGALHFECYKKTTNLLDMGCQQEIQSGSPLEAIDVRQIEVMSKGVKSEKIGSNLFRFYNLQKLQGALILKVSGCLILHQSASHPQGNRIEFDETLDLQRPLISKKQDYWRHSISRMPGAKNPDQTTYQRQATEQTEPETDSLNYVTGEFDTV